MVRNIRLDRLSVAHLSVSVCLSVCLSVWKVYCGKTADWIWMPFRVVSGVGRLMGVLDGWWSSKKGQFWGWIWGVPLGLCWIVVHERRTLLKLLWGLVITRDSIYAIARICHGNSVCLSVRPSVRLSHGWISQKRLKLGPRNFHHTVAPSH